MYRIEFPSIKDMQTIFILHASLVVQSSLIAYKLI